MQRTYVSSWDWTYHLDMTVIQKKSEQLIKLRSTLQREPYDSLDDELSEDNNFPRQFLKYQQANY